jgi:N6-adenosine-specific RNA methylase IME4
MKKYKTIVVDAPWEMVRSFGGYNWQKGERIRRTLDYPTMSVEEIQALPLNKLADKDCNLYLWTTQKYLRQAMDLFYLWDFNLINTLIWCKPRGGFVGGLYFSNTEFLLYARNGKANTKTKMNSQWFVYPRGEHSQKPEDFQDMIEKLHHPPYLEMFARRKRKGWDVWGNEVESDIKL